MSKRIPTDGGEPLAHRPFAGLGGTAAGSAREVSGEASLEASAGASGATKQTPVKPAKPAPAWAVVRLERKGRGGKEVTAIEKLELKPKDLEGWTKQLKQQLGCGGSLEGKTIVLQGDQRERAAAWLEQRVKKVTRG